MPYLATKEDKSHIPQCNASNYIIKVATTGDLFISNGRAIKECADDRQCFLINDVIIIFLGRRVHFWGHIVWLVFPSDEMFVWTRLLVCPDLSRSGEMVSRKLPRETFWTPSEGWNSGYFSSSQPTTTQFCLCLRSLVPRVSWSGT